MTITVFVTRGNIEWSFLTTVEKLADDLKRADQVFANYAALQQYWEHKP